MLTRSGEDLLPILCPRKGDNSSGGSGQPAGSRRILWGLGTLWDSEREHAALREDLPASKSARFGPKNPTIPSRSVCVVHVGRDRRKRQHPHCSCARRVDGGPAGGPRHLPQGFPLLLPHIPTTYLIFPPPTSRFPTPPASYSLSS